MQITDPIADMLTRIRNAGTAVIVRVNGDGNMLTVFEIFVHIFDLTCVDVGETELDRYGKIDDYVVVFVRF